MLIHDNIKFLRLSRKLSQEKLAKSLGNNLKRSNIASYEQATSPPIAVLVKLARHFNVSVDDLLTVDLSKSLEAKAKKQVSGIELAQRLDKVVKISGKDVKEFAAFIGTSVKELNKLLSPSAALPDSKLLLSICSSCSWLSLEWLVRGSGVMVLDRSEITSEVEDPAGLYIKGEQVLFLELEIDRLKERMNKLEKLVKPGKTMP